MRYEQANNQRSRCVICARMFAHKRSGAMYCSDLCKKRAYRARKREVEREKNVERGDNVHAQPIVAYETPRTLEDMLNDPF